MNSNRKHKKYLLKQSGFTLVELSIVLIIVALILGGVLVGGTLVSAARIRSAVAQIESYDSMVFTFRDRYNAIPGDFIYASEYGLGANGDGDGIITNNAVGDFLTYEGEMASFWAHLVGAGLLLAPYDGIGSEVGEDFPSFELGKSGVVVLSIKNRGNYYGIGMQNGGLVIGKAMTPFEASIIDSKIDDTKPRSGRFVALGGVSNLCSADYFGDPANFLALFEADNPCNQNPSPRGCVITFSNYNLRNSDNVCGALLRSNW